MNLTVLETAEQSFLSLEELKAYLRITHELEDHIIYGCLASAIEWVENYTGQVLQKKKVAFTIPFNRRSREKMGLSMKLWHSSGRSLFFFPVGPLLELGEVAIISNTGEVQAVSNNKIHLNQDKNPPFLIIDESGGWGFRVQCWVGYEENSRIPPLLKQSVLQAAACLYENRGAGATTLASHCGGMLNVMRQLQF